jgi:hypothetical protein
LTLLTEYAPGLAPTPIEADFSADPPRVVMSRLPGVPLREPVTAVQVEAVVDAIRTVQEAVPSPVLADLPWDGARISIVDFEYAGRSDRAFELAEAVEHVSVWVNDAFGAVSLLSRFGLTGAEALRLRECRRLLAIYWLMALLRDNPGSARNPPGTLECQAARLLDLLN